jgi:catechol 2,3-dioxygenase-like lactoylglutathione lyase family enzyme
MTNMGLGGAGGVDEFPVVRQVVLDCPHPRVLAEFYRQLLGYAYRPGDETPAPGEPDPRGEDWLVLLPSRGDATSGRGIAFQATDDYVRPEWRSEDGTGGAHDAARQRQMLHLDMTVPDIAALTRQRDRALSLGATILLDRSSDEDEALYVFADPEGHPFCIFV